MPEAFDKPAPAFRNSESFYAGVLALALAGALAAFGTLISIVFYGSLYFILH